LPWFDFVVVLVKRYWFVKCFSNPEGSVMLCKNISWSLVAFAVLAVPAMAGELNVQGGSSTGGNASTICGTVGGLCRFSVTGAFNDVATAQLGPTGGNAVIAARSIRELATWSDAQLWPLKRYSQEKLGDGQTRVLLGVAHADAAFNGGKVILRRGSAVIDEDPVIIN
jgi:hypothetical protein